MKKLIALIGHTGSGKTTIEKDLIESGLFVKFLSSTTREARPLEKEGKDYNFLNEELFNLYKEKNLFIEHVKYGTSETTGKDIQYGFLKEEIKKLKNDHCICVLTPSGYLQLKEKLNNITEVIPFFIKTDEEVRYEMCKKRHADQLEDYIEQIEKRKIFDKEIFKDVELLDGIKIVQNNYDEESKELILVTILQSVYIANERGEKKND